MQGAEERRLRRMNFTPQGGAIEGNATDDILMVDQGLRDQSGSPGRAEPSSQAFPSA